jgi:hypothetical protein
MRFQRETGRAGLCSYLKKKVTLGKGTYRKVTFDGHIGAPDYLVWMPNWTFGRFAEIKKPRHSVLAVAQQEEHSILRSMGFSVSVIYTKEEVEAFLCQEN